MRIAATTTARHNASTQRTATPNRGNPRGNALTLSRHFPRLAALMMIAFTVVSPAAALDYPVRPVRIVVGNAAGSTVDLLGRLMGQWLSERLGQQFIVENRPGAGANIATEAVVNAQPDGYTLLFVTTSNMINATLYEKLTFNFIRDIAPVASLARGPLVMEVNPAFPAKTVPEFIAYAKANPGKLNVASGGAGTSPHMSGELFKMMAGIDMLHVPYRGISQALTDLIGGQVQLAFDTTAGSLGYIRSGKLRALAVTTATRIEALPEVPPLGDFVPGYESSSFNGIGAPKGTPDEIVNLLNREINAGLTDAKMKARLVDVGGIVVTGSPADYRKLIAAETEKWAKVVRFTGAKAE
jgi:tripartite-type tricarboxylate transporter receptor subunit TctC